MNLDLTLQFHILNLAICEGRLFEPAPEVLCQHAHGLVKGTERFLYSSRLYAFV